MIVPKMLVDEMVVDFFDLCIYLSRPTRTPFFVQNKLLGCFKRYVRCY